MLLAPQPYFFGRKLLSTAGFWEKYLWEERFLALRAFNQPKAGN
jgi:hypothetical protein